MVASNKKTDGFPPNMRSIMGFLPVHKGIKIERPPPKLRGVFPPAKLQGIPTLGIPNWVGVPLSKLRGIPTLGTGYSYPGYSYLGTPRCPALKVAGYSYPG